VQAKADGRQFRLIYNRRGQMKSKNNRT